jgi:F0F1-type ATP synthase membrane subunit b/b'
MKDELKKMLEYEAKAREILEESLRKADKIRGDSQRQAEELLKSERFKAEDEAQRNREEIIRDAREEGEKMKVRTAKNIQEQEARAKKRMDKAGQMILKEVFNLS